MTKGKKKKKREGQAGERQALKKISNKTLAFYHEGFPAHCKKKKKPKTFSVPVLKSALVSKKKNESELKEK